MSDKTTYEEFRDSSPENALLLAREELALEREELRLADAALAAATAQLDEARKLLQGVLDDCYLVDSFTVRIAAFLDKTTRDEQTGAETPRSPSTPADE